MKRFVTLGLLLTVVIMLLPACAAPAPQVVKEIVTVEVEKQVQVEKVVTQVVEKQVEKVVTQVVEKQVEVTPTPAPTAAPQVISGFPAGISFS